jgi:hypothetical protein
MNEHCEKCRRVRALMIDLGIMFALGIGAGIAAFMILSKGPMQ